MEACPKDAIRMDSGIFTKVEGSRDSFISDINELSSRKRGEF